jgi:hypothetical protein
MLPPEGKVCGVRPFDDVLPFVQQSTVTGSGAQADLALVFPIRMDGQQWSKGPIEPCGANRASQRTPGLCVLGVGIGQGTPERGS